MKHLEWTDERAAMIGALRVINVVMLDNEDSIEETAFAEVQLVARLLKQPENIGQAQLVDFLTQAVIDFNKMNEEYSK